YIEQDNIYKQITPMYTTPVGRLDDWNNTNQTNIPYWFDNPYESSPPGIAGETGGYPPLTIYTVGKTRIKTCTRPSAPEKEPDNNAFGQGYGTTDGGWIIGGPMVRNGVPNPTTVATTGFWYENYDSVETLMPLGQTNYVGCAGLGRGSNTNL